MWNLKYGSRAYERYHSFKSHKEHIERLVSAKPVIQTNTPKSPSFLYNSKIKYCIEREKHLKADWDNKNLYWKMVNIDNHLSQYSKQKTVPIFSFSSAKSHFKDNVMKRTITHENNKMHDRLQSAKTAYSIHGYKKHHKNNRYLNSQIRNCVPNPKMNYATLNQFNRNLSFQMRRERMASSVNDSKRLFTSTGLKSNYSPWLSTYNNNRYDSENEQSPMLNGMHYYTYGN